MSTRQQRVAAPEPVIPQRKISETIIDFGQPVLHDLRADTPIEIVRASFTIAISVWNAHVMAMPVWNAPQALAQLQAILKMPTVAPEMVQAYHDLTERRHSLFASDPRSVGQWSVSPDETGNVKLSCDAHVPPSLMPREK